jgi:hypothetical protein
VAARAEKLAADLAAATEAAAAAATRADTSIALARVGVTDPDAADLVLYRYGRLAEADRPALADWLGGAAKADPLLAAVWGQPAAAAPAAPPTPPPAGQPAAPPPPAGRPNGAAVATPGPGPAPLSPEALSQLARDPVAWAAQRDAVRAAAGLPVRGLPGKN